MQTWILDKTDGGEKALFWQVFVKGRKKCLIINPELSK